MSLATRCTTCGTVFRVVQDQLKISEGWVRCGRCNEVFNALEGLFDLEREAPPEWQGQQGQPGRNAPDVPLPAMGEEPTEPTDPFLVERMDQQIFGRKRNEETPSAPKRRSAPRHTRVELPLRGADIALEPPDPHEPLRYEPELRPDPRDIPDIDLSRIETLEVEPEFVRRAKSEARWRRSPQRWALGALGLLLAGGLAMQWALHYRDYVATRWPATASTLTSWCQTLGCTVGPLRRIESLSVDSSALTRAGGSSDATFRLTLTLHNRGDLPLAMPWVDLTLTDASGLLVARRALAPKDFRVVQPAIAAGAEQQLQLVLAAGNPRVSGYTVEIFYP
jgi:predicted Zn finger-like uncharacterized protein